MKYLILLPVVLMPWLMASRGLAIRTGLPSMTTRPVSIVSAPKIALAVSVLAFVLGLSAFIAVALAVWAWAGGYF